MSKIALILQIFIFVSVWSVQRQKTLVDVCSCQRQSMLRAEQSETNAECFWRSPSDTLTESKNVREQPQHLKGTFPNTEGGVCWKEKSLNMWVKINELFWNGCTEILHWGKDQDSSWWICWYQTSELLSSTWELPTGPSLSWLPARPFSLHLQQ